MARGKFVPYRGKLVPCRVNGARLVNLDNVQVMQWCVPVSQWLAMRLPARLFVSEERSCRLLFQVCGEEFGGALPCVDGIGGTVAVFVVGIFKSVAGVVIDFDVDRFAELF